MLNIFNYYYYYYNSSHVHFGHSCDHHQVSHNKNGISMI